MVFNPGADVASFWILAIVVRPPNAALFEMEEFFAKLIVGFPIEVSFVLCLFKAGMVFDEKCLKGQ